MGQYKPDQNFTKGAKKLDPNPPPYDANNTKYRWDRPKGYVEIPDTPVLLKHTSFASAALGQTTALPEIYHYSSDTTKRAVVVENGGTRVLRMNFNTADTGVDPVSGQGREGNFTSCWNAGAYYNKSDYPAIIYKYRYRLDDSYWAANLAEGPFPHPVGDGKMFFCDRAVKQLAWYLGFKNFDTRRITIVSGNNGTGPWDPYNGWTKTETYGWREADGITPIGRLDLVCDDGFIMRTDGEWYEPTIEFLYNPGNIGHNKIRIRSSTGSIYRDLTHGNTDADGWLNMYLDYEFIHLKYYSSTVAFSAGRLDVTTAPELYDGYAGGIDFSDFWLSFGKLL